MTKHLSNSLIRRSILLMTCTVFACSNNLNASNSSINSEAMTSLIVKNDFRGNYWKGKGRIVLSSDGNRHDNDDWAATTMTFMILAKAGLQNNTTLYVYADHIWSSENNDLEMCTQSAKGSAEIFGFTKTKLMAGVSNPEAAYTAMSKEIIKSTPSNPLFILAAGPMQVVGSALDIALNKKAESLRSVTIVSHSTWNEQHSDHPDKGEPKHEGWTWKEMKDKFGKYVNFVDISDQNGTGTGSQVYKSKDKFAARSWDTWNWLRDSKDKGLNWVYNFPRNIAKVGPDYSDAGMAYYLVADLDGVRGDDMGNPLKLKAWITGIPYSQIMNEEKTLIENSSKDVEVFYNGGMTVGDDFIAIEAECTKSPLGSWKLLQKGNNDYSAIKGDIEAINSSYIESSLGQVNGLGSTAGTDILEYYITPKKTGDYKLTGRMAQHLTNGTTKALWDQCNDIYVKMDGDDIYAGYAPLNILNNWTKFYGRGFDSWGAFIQGDENHNKHKMVYRLTGGKRYKFSISTRSKGCAIDYFLFSTANIKNMEKVDLATSNPEKYRPGFPSKDKKGYSVIYNSVDFDRFTSMGDGFVNASIDKKNNTLQIANRLKTGAAEVVYKGPDKKYDFFINTMLETDGESTFTVYVNNKQVGTITNDSIFGSLIKDYTIKSYKLSKSPIAIKNGDIIRVVFNSATNGKVLEGNTTATSRGRWKNIELKAE